MGSIPKSMALILLLVLALLGSTLIECVTLSNSTSSQDLHAQFPQIVLVPGVGHGSWAWFQVINSLQSEGYIAKAIDLNSKATVTTLAQYLKPLIDHLESVRGPVVLVGHGIGGGSVSYAAEKFPEKVQSMIFIAAIMPKNGFSILQSFPPGVVRRLATIGYVILDNGKTISLNKDRLGEFFYNQSPQYVDLARPLVAPSPYKPLGERLVLTGARYGSKPRYYLRTPKDLAITPADQDHIIAANPPIAENHVVDADHAPFFSNPADLVKMISFLAKID